MADLDDPSIVRKMSASEIKEKKKPELQRAVMALLKESPVTSDEILKECGDIASILKQLLGEIKQLREEGKDMKQEITALRATNDRIMNQLQTQEKLLEENESLKSKIKLQGTVLKQHQAFFETIDAKERERNMIIIGLEEGNEDEDMPKVKQLLSAVQGNAIDGQVASVKRLGEKIANKTRPLLTIMTTKEERNKSVEAARNSRHDAMRGIRIKKDTHPAIRAEWTRLFKVKRRSLETRGTALPST
jgi:hypothetical protein